MRELRSTMARAGGQPGRRLRRAGLCCPRISRRSLLAAALAGGVGVAAGIDEPPPAAVDDERLLKLIEERASEVGLSPLRSSRTAGFLGIGDAPDPFRESALQTCEAIALDYYDYYKAQGFDPQHPRARLAVVTLAGRRSFLSFLEVRTLAAHVVGLYGRKSNILVVYDSRSEAASAPAGRARFFNQVSLAHEATHQLTFNTGLLNRPGDVPLAMVEGLALYGETRKTTGRTEPGLVNQERLGTLAHGQRRGLAWIPSGRLLVEDQLISDSADADRMNFAYAQSWLLVHYLMKSPKRQPAFRAYLKAVYPRTDTTHRLDDARAHLGDLERLDAELRYYSVQLLKTAR
jgi:hypothetical protein